jgi:hypothetical protein
VCRADNVQTRSVQGHPFGTEDQRWPCSTPSCPLIFRTPLGQNPGIAEYQVLQTHDGAKIAVVATGPIDVATLRQELIDGLAKPGLPNAQIEIDLVDSLKRHEETGKLKRFIPIK